MIYLTEKPLVAAEFAKALNLARKEDGFYTDGKTCVTFCKGHLLETATPEKYNEAYTKWTLESLPILPPKFLYTPIEENKKQLETVKRLLVAATKANHEIVIATDPDREGEVIARLVISYCGLETYPKITRFWVSEILTERTIKEGIEKRKSWKEYETLGAKGKAFKETDWIFGINLSRLASLKLGNTMSVGRVQTAVLYEIYRRHVEKMLFIEKKYTEATCYTVQGIRAKLLKNGEIWKAGDETEKKEMTKKIERIKGEKEARVTSIQREEKKEAIPALYNQSALEIDAYKLYGIPLKRTLEICQQLYEKEKVLSYPRTESRVMGENDYERFIEIFGKVNGLVGGMSERKKEVVQKDDTRIFNNKKCVGHYALIPLEAWKPARTDTEEYKIYDLVVRRYLMQFTEPYQYTMHTVYMDIKGTAWKGTVKEETKKGWKTIERKEAQEEEDEQEVRIQGEIQEKQIIQNIAVEAKKTKPPKWYTQATILRFMVNPKGAEETGKLVGLGTEATRSTYVEVLKQRNFIVEEKKNLKITDEGIRLIEFLNDIPSLAKGFKAEETTRWEETVEKNPEQLYDMAKQGVEKAIGEGKVLETKGKEITILGTCPSCGGNIEEGKKGYYCSNYNKEDTPCPVSLGKKVMGIEVKKELVQELLQTNKTPFFKGTTKEGKKVQFRFGIVDNEIKVVFDGSKKEVGVCPLCSKKVYEGDTNYYCAGYKEGCTFKLWKKTNGSVFTQDMIHTLLETKELKKVKAEAKNKEIYYVNYRLENGELIKSV